MSLPAFLDALQENGRVRVGIAPEQKESSPAELEKADAKLRQLDAVCRADLAFAAPEFRLEAARWAAKLLYQGCQFLVFREINTDTVRQALSVSCPEKSSPAVCYSVDLTFRYLPDLIALSRGVSEGDPLVIGLSELARAWPLSSVGVRSRDKGTKDKGTEQNDALDISPFIEDLSLRRLYADRIIACADSSRLNDPLVLEAVREGIGAHEEFWKGESLAAH